MWNSYSFLPKGVRNIIVVHPQLQVVGKCVRQLGDYIYFENDFTAFFISLYQYFIMNCWVVYGCSRLMGIYDNLLKFQIG